MNHQERFQFLLSRPQLPTDEAARFVETRIAVPSQLNALYSERSGNFVTVEQGRKEEQIRSASSFPEKQ
jgi:hypothetical protein